ncbi:MAG: DUF4234 domain-containing protein [Planctomycetota bacterium]|jgi:hypothetical protein
MVERSEVPVFKADPIIALILSLLTCGIYQIYWNLKMADVLNAVTGKQTIAPVLAAIGGCCWPLNIYYFYLLSQAMGDIGKIVGKEKEFKDKSTMVLILGILFYPVATMIVQQCVNEIYAEKQ